ncbi:hypothetical protein AMES_3267 [Amycolatopsis mediterranei S699]|uniref:Secreted protein n=2 Tax=Amycolatopsis mediterranei TaxID=33910 RepID=A0A0H3D4H4_AMYMU|nr:hypothetical protein [Amycolatopsis mediterranei]ADJ45092.1 hypothetical protein AMED_3303 [Amycolatopsis mediterranei U32]AEK41849.1 hypothetical protein RAM_16805 [Amycolatopsis mediterranei S699]AFO76803.1 hypothetical protein AMES_3267 [Amycolatopsis mediterranei S699]AGT83931.1 hypothetical protein B737_3267 [Amycolatopsis mediterranei RB]KDO08732.1 hypothetical protein DV26_21845 [Amycolatopsis mediterranei]
MKFTAKRVAVSGAVAGVAVVAVGATVIATAADPVSPEVVSAVPADAGHGDEGKYTTGDYVLNVHELDDDGDGITTAIGPHTMYYSKTLHGSGNRKATVVKFSAGPDSDASIVFSYPVPAPGRVVDCTASGTETAPQVRCETKPAR